MIISVAHRVMSVERKLLSENLIFGEDKVVLDLILPPTSVSKDCKASE